MPQFRVVSDPDDPAVTPFRAIKERDLVGREGLFIAEGETVLRAFVRDAPERVVSLLIEPVAARDLLASLPARAVVLVLCGIANHDNMGGIYRNAAAFGADAVVLDADCCDPLYRKAIRVSVGAVLSVPTAHLARGEDIADLLAATGFEGLALSPSADEILAQLTPPPRTAVLLGAEGPGLTPQVMARVRTVGIPMAGGFDSLNVATTSGIVLHHLRFAQA